MPVRVGLAIVGSICLTIAFAVGLLWGYIAPSLLAEDLQQTAQNSLSGVLVMILIWISIATFIPSAERRTNNSQTAPKAEEEPIPVVQIRETEPAAVVYDDEPELVE
jgi:Na+/H+ antiporter NhaC